MPRNKNKIKINKKPSPTIQNDFTIEECANAVKLTNRTRKPHSNSIVVTPDFTWEPTEPNNVQVTLIENETDLSDSEAIEKPTSKRNKKKSIVHYNANWYPEVVWYLISDFIRPEWVGTFALINKQTYAITKTEAFWRKLYTRYCKKKNVPEKLRLENDYKVYGLQQRVVRALYHSYHLFKQSIYSHSAYSIGQDKRPYELIRRRCISMWYKKEQSHWSVYFKLKRNNHRINGCRNFLQEMDRIDANDEESCKVLEVTCETVNLSEHIFGMTLATVNISLSQNFRKHKLRLGFTSAGHNVCKEIIPECVIEINEVTGVSVMDWWHPDYPHTEGSMPSMDKDRQVLDEDFFS